MGIAFDSGLGQRVEELFLGRSLAMMVLLDCNVLPNGRPRGGDHRKCHVTFLPAERPQADLVMCPRGRSFLQLAHDVRQTMSRFKADQQMDMIGHTADTLRKSAEAGDGSPRYSCSRARHSTAITGSRFFRREYQMIMQAPISRRHREVARVFPFLRDGTICRRLIIPEGCQPLVRQSKNLCVRQNILATLSR